MVDLKRISQCFTTRISKVPRNWIVEDIQSTKRIKEWNLNGMDAAYSSFVSATNMQCPFLVLNPHRIWVLDRCFIGIITTYTLHNRTTVIWSVFSRTNPRISWRAVNRWHFVSHCLRPFYCLNRFFSLYLASLFFDLFCVWISIVDWLCAVHSVIVSVFS